MIYGDGLWLSSSINILVKTIPSEFSLPLSSIYPSAILLRKEDEEQSIYIEETMSILPSRI